MYTASALYCTKSRSPANDFHLHFHPCSTPQGPKTRRGVVKDFHDRYQCLDMCALSLPRASSYFIQRLLATFCGLTSISCATIYRGEGVRHLTQRHEPPNLVHLLHALTRWVPPHCISLSRFSISLSLTLFISLPLNLSWFLLSTYALLQLAYSLALIKMANWQGRGQAD